MAMVKTIVLNINGMHCTSCCLSIDGDLEDTKGIKSAKTSYAREECEVEFDEKIVKIEQIVKTIGNTGYSAQVKNE